jgi:DNA polymerase-4
VRRLLCARHHHLALVAAWRRHPELRAEPVVVGGAPELRLPVVAASAAAVASGVRSGQSLREAQQRCPAAAFVAVDEAAVAGLRVALLSLLCQLAPAAEVGDETSWCDLTGRHAGHRDETAWAVAIARGVAGLLDDDGVGAGVAGSRLVAEVAARQAGPRRIRRVAGGEEAGFLAPLPLCVLPIDGGIAARLAALGLDCVGAVASLSAAQLQRQFGPAGLELWHRVRGEDGVGEGRLDRSLGTWPTRGGAVGQRVVLDGGVGDLEALRFAVHRTAVEVGERLRRRGCRAATVTLLCELEDRAEPVGLRLAPARPPGSGAELWPVALELLGGLRLLAPVTAIRLEVDGLEQGSGRQVDLWRGDSAVETIEGAASRLRARLGAAAVRHAELAVDPGDLPERRFRWAGPMVEAVGTGHGTVTGLGGPWAGPSGAAGAGVATATTALPGIPALRR